VETHLLTLITDDGGTWIDVLDPSVSCHPYAGGDYNGHCGGCDTCMIMQAEHAGMNLRSITEAEAAAGGRPGVEYAGLNLTDPGVGS